MISYCIFKPKFFIYFSAPSNYTTNTKTVNQFKSYPARHDFGGASACRATHFLCPSRGQIHPVAVATATHSAKPEHQLD